MNENPVLKAAAYFGSQAELARVIRVSRRSVTGWVRDHSRMKGDYAVALERATHGAVTRDLFRPDLFTPAGNNPGTAQPASGGPVIILDNPGSGGRE